VRVGRGCLPRKERQITERHARRREVHVALLRKPGLGEYGYTALRAPRRERMQLREDALVGILACHRPYQAAQLSCHTVDLSQRGNPTSARRASPERTHPRGCQSEMRDTRGIVLAILALLHDTPTPELPRLTDSMSRAVESSQERIQDHVAFRRLTSRNAELAVGRACGIAGTPPPGQLELALLVNHERTDLLSRALGAPTPEARVYAALGLWSMRVISDDERQHFMSAIDTPVRMCSGCLFWSASATEVVARYAERSEARPLEF
jgi:hypothetical protein